MIIWVQLLERPPPKIWEGKNVKKIPLDFWQLSKLIANICTSYWRVENQKSSLRRLAKKCLYFGPPTKKLHALMLTHLKPTVRVILDNNCRFVGENLPKALRYWISEKQVTNYSPSRWLGLKVVRNAYAGIGFNEQGGIVERFCGGICYIFLVNCFNANLLALK